jgi:antitoxin CptB
VSDPLDVRRKRIRFRGWHRGMKEMDLILGIFIDAELENLPAEELDALEALLEVPDDMLYAWVVGREPVEPAHDTALFKRICGLSHLDGTMFRQK